MLIFSLVFVTQLSLHVINDPAHTIFSNNLEYLIQCVMIYVQSQASNTKI